MAGLEIEDAWLEDFKKIYHMLYQYMETACRPFGLTAVQTLVLLQLHRKGLQTLTALSDDLGVTKGNLSMLCRRMQKAGLIQFSGDASDRRLLYLSATPEGVDRLKMVSNYHKTHSYSSASLTPEDKDLIYRGLHKLKCYLECARIDEDASSNLN